MQDTHKVDLTNCDREPIHIPGSIQPHGCLIACDIASATILRHSANTAEILGIDGDLNGRTLEDVIGSQAAHDLRNALSVAGSSPKPSLLFGLAIANGRLFDTAIHHHKSITIIEFEPADTTTGQPLGLARGLISHLSNIRDQDRLIRDTARLVQGMLGYDRVMIYQFGADGAGQVVSEVRRGDLESFLGQYFPASDIPQQARALYLKNTIRIISDADGEQIPVVPERDVSGEALDLSFAHLRSVSPIHCEYLRNMGVGASMSISIIVNGELWGLIACHHYSPRILPMAQRVAAEIFGEFFSLHLEALRHKRRLDTATEARRSLDRVLKQASSNAGPLDVLKDSLPDFSNLIPCDGVGLWIKGTWTCHKTCIPDASVPALARLVTSIAEEGKIWATNALSSRLAGAEAYYEDVSGVLAVPLSQIPGDYLFFFRKEVTQTLSWAGNPEKSYTTGPMGDRLTPRKSFAIWKETVHKQSAPWLEAEREIAEAARGALVEVLLRFNELMAEERAKADVRQRMLNEELNHRVKNILAVIKSLIGHPVQEGRSLKDYVDSLKGRIQSLAHAHDQVIRGDGGGELSDLLTAELSPYRHSVGNVALDGPTVWMDARAFSVMALVLHELATNAAKYGALSSTAGHLGVTWSFLANGDCEVLWQESGGPPVAPPSREGFGTALIDRSIPYDLHGESSITYASEGVKARFLLPSRHLSLSRPENATYRRVPTAAKPVEIDFSRLKILLVEDQMLIALDVETMLADKGVTQIVTSGSAEDALQKLQTFEPDVGILDVNLGVGTSIPVAEELWRREIPFIFATGYADSQMIPTAFSSVAVVRKPYDREALLSTLVESLERHASAKTGKA